MSIDELIRLAISAENVTESLELLGKASHMAADGDSYQVARISELTGYFLHRTGRLDDAQSHFIVSENNWQNIPLDFRPERRAAMYCNYANLLCDLGVFGAAKKHMDVALDIELRILGPNNTEYARSLCNSARILRATGEVEEACHQARQAVGIIGKSKNPQDQRDNLYAQNILGMALMDFGSWDEALTIFQEIIKATDNAVTPEIYYSVVNNIGWAHFGLGDFKAAATWYEKALGLVKGQTGSAARIAEATILTNLGSISHKQDEFEAACHYYRQARDVLEHAVADGKHPQMLTICSNLGISLFRLLRFTDSHQQFQHALKLQDEFYGDTHKTAADIRFHLAELKWSEGHKQEAIDVAVDVLALPGLHASNDLVWRIFNLIARSLFDSGHKQISILFGKQAVEILERECQGAKSLGQHLETHFTRSRSAGFRDLADQLIASNRLVEAEHALKRLRAAEQVILLGRSGETLSVGSPGYSVQEDLWREQYGPALFKISQARDRLAQLSTDAKNKEEIAETRRLIGEYAHELSISVANLIRYGLTHPIPVTQTDSRAVPDVLSIRLHPDEILLHFFPVDNHLWILRRDGQGNTIRRQIATEAASLNALIMDFRHALSSPNSSITTIKAISLRLYDLLIRPILDENRDKDARLIFWFDGALRFLPPSALFDGKEYLIEQHSMSLYTPFASQTGGRQRTLAQHGIAGFATGRTVSHLASLPFSVREVEAVVRGDSGDGLFGGERFLDDRFSPDHVKQAAEHFGGLLIASHFVLHPANLNRSGLLTGTGEIMPVRQIAKMDFSGLSLVTISGCDTGTASLDGDSALLQSLADCLILKGAGAVLASLWQISDAGSASLVTEFYARLAENKTVDYVSALAASQRYLASGGASGKSDGGVRGIGAADIPDMDWSHPYYWAPFILLQASSKPQDFSI